MFFRKRSSPTLVSHSTAFIPTPYHSSCFISFFLPGSPALQLELSAVRDFSEAPFYLQHVIQIGASDTFWKEERKKGGRSRREGKRHHGSSHSKAGHRCRTLMRCVFVWVLFVGAHGCITTDFPSKLLEGPAIFAVEDPHLMFVSGGSFGTVRRKTHRWCQRGAGWAQTFTMVEGVGSTCFRGRKRLPAHF